MASLTKNLLCMVGSRSKIHLRNVLCVTQFHTSATIERARKGTRMRKEAIKKARKLAAAAAAPTTPAVKEFIPKKLRLQMVQTKFVSPRKDDGHKKDPIDDVYVCNQFKRTRFPVVEAVAMHRQTHHPTQFNNMNEQLTASIEFSMLTDKGSQYLDGFSSIVLLPHLFEIRQKRTVLALCRDDAMVNSALDAGASAAFGKEFVKLIKAGDLQLDEFDHIVAHTSIILEANTIKTKFGNRYPNLNKGTLGPDILPLVLRFSKGLQYKAEKDKHDHDYAVVRTSIGNLSMEDHELEANLKCILLDANKKKPKTKKGEFITAVRLRCFPTEENFYINHLNLLQDTQPLLQDHTIEENNQSAVN